jgi:UDP-glucose 4-epimerase
MRVMATCSAGFIGSHVFGKLIVNGFDLRISDSGLLSERQQLAAFEPECSELVRSPVPKT